ncbi:MAG: hypothetical protein AAF215_29895 [Cyanobacteria bacterium P01_A01_bin.123]
MQTLDLEVLFQQLRHYRDDLRPALKGHHTADLSTLGPWLL